MIKVIISKKEENVNINKNLLESLESFNNIKYINEALKNYKNNQIEILEEEFYKMSGIISKDYNVWFNYNISDTKNIIMLNNENKLLAVSNSFYNNFLEKSFEQLLAFTEFVKNVEDEGFVIAEKEFIKINLVGNEYKMFTEITKQKKEEIQSNKDNEEIIQKKEENSISTNKETIYKEEIQDNIDNEEEEQTQDNTQGNIVNEEITKYNEDEEEEEEEEEEANLQSSGTGMIFDLKINDSINTENESEEI